jgi:hypothetical protein
VAQEWNVSGEWNISQANGWHVKFDIQQDGTELRGTAFASHPFVADTMTGNADGEVALGPRAPGQPFEFTVSWAGARTVKSRYAGTFGFDRRLSGLNYVDVVGELGIQTTWVSDKQFD